MKLLLILPLVLSSCAGAGTAMKAILPNEFHFGVAQTWSNNEGFIAGVGPLQGADFATGGHGESFTVYGTAVYSWGRPDVYSDRDLERSLSEALQEERREAQRLLAAQQEEARRRDADRLERDIRETRETATDALLKDAPAEDRPTEILGIEIPDTPDGVNPTLWYLLVFLMILLIVLFGPGAVRTIKLMRENRGGDDAGPPQGA